MRELKRGMPGFSEYARKAALMGPFDRERFRIASGVCKADDDELLGAMEYSGLGRFENGWRPIETAPKDGTRILVCRNELVQPVTIGYWSMVECRFVTPLTTYWHPATHWMPLPPPAHQ